MKRRDTINLSKLTDEEIREFMDSIAEPDDYDTDEEDVLFLNQEEDEINLQEMFDQAILMDLDIPETSLQIDNTPQTVEEEVVLDVDMIDLDHQSANGTVEVSEKDDDEVEMYRPSTCGNFTGDIMEIRASAELKKSLWRKTFFQIHSREMKFLGASQMPQEILECVTPYDFGWIFNFR